MGSGPLVLTVPASLSVGSGPLGAPGLLSLAAEAESRPGAAELFEQQCAERLGGGGSSSEEDDEEEDGGRLRMEVDMSDPWAPSPAAMDTNVWQSAPAADLSADRDWADFGAFPTASGRPPSPPLLPSPAAEIGELSRGYRRQAIGSV